MRSPIPCGPLGNPAATIPAKSLFVEVLAPPFSREGYCAMSALQRAWHFFGARKAAAMSNLHEALKRALSKGDIRDANYRRTVYESAATALQRSLAAKPGAAAELVQQQKDRLADAIRDVETDIRKNLTSHAPEPPVAPQAPAAATPVRAPEPPPNAPAVNPPPRAPAPAQEAKPSVPAQPRPSAKGAIRVEPRLDDVAGDDAVEIPQAKQSSSPLRIKRGPFAFGFSTIVVIALVLIGLMWVLVSGAFMSQEARDTSVPNPATVFEDENFQSDNSQTSTAPLTQADIGSQSRDWITLFTPSDPTTLGLSGGASATIESDPFGDFARIDGPQGGVLQVDVPPGALRSLAGRPVQISIRARAEAGAETQMSVSCDFGGQVSCARKRFTVGQAPADFVSLVDLSPYRADNQPVTIDIVPDIAGQGRALNLLEVRIRAVDEG